MYLQSLEIVGFKSFAPKTTLEFKNGVTAVVGPNGCGKSNVLDALRWVLGEQSAKALRGGEMADVIFSGTDSRPPLGMAEVSLTFADCETELGVEWSEVCVTRRVFRDGKSEYFLNKTPCRLRDVHELFMDTGIGRSAYSVMEQGKIDAILSSRPEDRRAVFEEAAGITKFKAQKKEALRKLEYTEANLLRVEDIIKEVKRQIGSLQRQAGKARRYQALMADLRTFDTHLSHRDFSTLNDELCQVEEDLIRSDEDRQSGQHDIEMRESELGVLREQLATEDQQVNAVRDEVQSQRSRIHAAQNRVLMNDERCAEARVLIDRSQGDIASAQDKIRDQECQIARTDELIAAILGVLRAGEQELHAQNEKLLASRQERVSIERRLQEISRDISQREGRLSSLRSDVSAAMSRREAAAARLQILKAEAASASAAHGQLSETLEAAVVRLAAAESALASARAEFAEAQLLQEEAQRARQDAERELNSANRAVAEHESRLDVLRQLNEEGEGFGEGTQAVLRGLDNPNFFRPAVLGALASFITVEPQNVPAIEAALGVNLQAILFKDPSVAESAILTLSAKKLGRAAVMPRDWIHPVGSGHGAPVITALPEGAIAWAADWVRVEDGIQPLIAGLLGNVVVVDTLETAFRLKPQHGGLGFVTLGGDFITPDGIAQGGRAAETGSSVLLRRAQMASLDRALADRRLQADQCAIRRTQALEMLDAAQERVRIAREGVQSAQLEFSTSHSERLMADRQLHDAARKLENLDRESVQIEEAVHLSVARVEDIERSIAEAVAQLEELRAGLAANGDVADHARERERIAADELNELRVRVAMERQQQEALTRQRGPMATRIAELSDLLGQRQRDITEYQERVLRLEAESHELGEKITTWNLLLQTGEDQIAKIQERRAAIQEQTSLVDEVLRAARRQLSEAQEKRGRLEVRQTQLRMRIDHLREHVSRRYQIDLSAFKPDTYALLVALRDREKKRMDSPNEDSGENPQLEKVQPPPARDGSEEAQIIPWRRVAELVTELTEKVDAMGPVNLDAIQEYDELEQRHTFLDKQHTDLVNSKAELLEVISKINRTTRELFAESFEKIRVNFQEMFTELFGGGKANLILVDESDPLESGIDIIAKPPGKQLQSISLLSGGERTMTAVALLFSIYMVKPSPFCVLDEMDAPLDESNINRFIKILDRFANQSQFVVITHNKRTIARADTVFGVTMEEHGVSKIVSVKFQRGETVEAPNGHPRSVAESFGKHGDHHSESSSGVLALAR